MKTKAEIREEFRKSMEKVDAIAQRRGLRYERSPYGKRGGKRGGTSANAGKKAATYEATLPNGQVVRKKSYHVDQPEAYISIWKPVGEDWRYGAVWANTTNIPEGMGWVKARRV